MKSPNITIVNKYGRPELTVHTLDYIKADAKPHKKILDWWTYIEDRDQGWQRLNKTHPSAVASWCVWDMNQRTSQCSTVPMCWSVVLQLQLSKSGPSIKHSRSAFLVTMPRCITRLLRSSIQSRHVSSGQLWSVSAICCTVYYCLPVGFTKLTWQQVNCQNATTGLWHQCHLGYSHFLHVIHDHLQWSH